MRGKLRSIEIMHNPRCLPTLKLKADLYTKYVTATSQMWRHNKTTRNLPNQNVFMSSWIFMTLGAFCWLISRLMRAFCYLWLDCLAYRAKGDDVLCIQIRFLFPKKHGVLAGPWSGHFPVAWASHDRERGSAVNSTFSYPLRPAQAGIAQIMPARSSNQIAAFQWIGL